MATPMQTLLVGGGMIAHDQLLPALYQLQREGLVGDITVCAQTGKTVQALAENATIRRAFPGHTFRPLPDYRRGGDLTARHPTLYRDALRELPPRQLVVMGLPDQLHHECILAALAADQHVIAVKPLVLTHAHALEIEREARRRGLFVGVEYHKRFDDRALLARQLYRQGALGNFRLGQAALLEPYYYRQSNFQNWCTCEHTDLFTYVGCHYVDQVHFITGLLPVEVSVYGIVDTYPNGRQGYLWTEGRVIWSNGGCLSVINAIGYPDAGAGSNLQGIRLIGQGRNDATLMIHDDQYRGLTHCYDPTVPGAPAKAYQEPSPDYLKLVYRGGEGLTPVGYGVRSVQALVQAVHQVDAAGDLAARQRVLARLDAEGILATPANSSFNELVIEAARLSITNNARPVTIDYQPEPQVRFKTWE